MKNTEATLEQAMEWARGGQFKDVLRREIIRLRSELAKYEGKIFSCGNCDKAASESASLREKVAQKEADRQYHMNALNRMAEAIGMLGETSDAIAEAVLTRIAKLACMTPINEAYAKQNAVLSAQVEKMRRDVAEGVESLHRVGVAVPVVLQNIATTPADAAPKPCNYCNQVPISGTCCPEAEGCGECGDCDEGIFPCRKKKPADAGPKPCSNLAHPWEDGKCQTCGTDAVTPLEAVLEIAKKECLGCLDYGRPRLEFVQAGEQDYCHMKLEGLSICCADVLWREFDRKPAPKNTEKP